MEQIVSIFYKQGDYYRTVIVLDVVIMWWMSPWTTTHVTVISYILSTSVYSLLSTQIPWINSTNVKIVIVYS